MEFFEPAKGVSKNISTFFFTGLVVAPDIMHFIAHDDPIHQTHGFGVGPKSIVISFPDALAY